MKICFPARKQNGENYATLDEMMGLTGQEPHGSWLAGTNRMWHGGIHISEKSAPGSVLTGEALGSAVPLQCMAEGEVVAWRLGQDYKKNTCLGQSLQYSTTFVLVKSLCQPDPKNDKTWLEFYTLYMGLAPLSAFKKCRCLVAKTAVLKRKAGKYESSSDGVANVPPSEGTLAEGDRVVILQEEQFRNGNSIQPFGLAQQPDKDGNISGNTFWVTTDPQYMEPAGEQYAHLPAWMQHAVSQGTFDDVVIPTAPVKINAGDSIGFLGEDIVPAGTGKTSSSHYVHIEVISADSRMPEFLDNPAKLTTGRKYIRIHADSPLYISAGNDFQATSNKVGKDIHVILPVDKCSPKKSGDRTYYQTGQNNWVSQDEVDVLNQYDLKELGFSAFAEESTPDMSASLKEGWVKSGFQWLEKQVMPERGIQEQQMSQFYKAMHAKLDADKNSELSGQELFAALHHPEMGVRDIVARMVVKHESEWFGGSAHQKWEKFFSTYDVLRLDYAKKWLDDMEWMSKVEPFTSGKAVWHMHPIVFLDALILVSEEIITLEMLIAANLGDKKSQCEKVLPYINKYAKSYGMNDKKEIAHFLSQIGHESGFLITEENLNYSAKGMRRTFGCNKGPVNYSNANDDCDLGRLRNKLWTEESHYAHNPENLANYVYSNRMGNLGEETGDGYRYRGRGMIQLTGKNGYEYFTNSHNKMNSGDTRDFVANPELVISDIEYGVESAFSFWVSKGLNKTAKAMSVYNVTDKVNGGQNGYADRLARFNSVAPLLSVDME